MSFHRQKILSKDRQWHHLNVVFEREWLSSRIDDDAAFRVKVFAGVMETPLYLGRETALDLDRPRAATRQGEEKVDLCTG